MERLTKLDELKEGETLRVTVYDGKYTVVQNVDGSVHVLRYGVRWRSAVGDGLVLALAQEVRTLREMGTLPFESTVQALTEIIVEASGRHGVGAFGEDKKEQIADTVRRFALAVKRL